MKTLEDFDREFAVVTAYVTELRTAHKASCRWRALASLFLRCTALLFAAAGILLLLAQSPAEPAARTSFGVTFATPERHAFASFSLAALVLGADWLFGVSAGHARSSSIVTRLGFLLQNSRQQWNRQRTDLEEALAAEPAPAPPLPAVAAAFDCFKATLNEARHIVGAP